MPENGEFSRIFSQIADILEIQEENVFRIRSYRRAAQVLESVTFGIASSALENPNAIRDLPGIGPAIFGKILEICQTGSCAEYEKLLQAVPASVLEMLELSGVGPRKIALFYGRGISDLDALADAARRQALRGLPGIGVKTEARILQSIEQRRSAQGRFRISQALEAAELLMESLHGAAGVERLSVAGSLRRWKETVADVDILAAARDSASVMERFTGSSEGRQVLASGTTKSSLLLRSGMQADLRVVPPECFGAALQYFTGSKEHNVVIRERAKRMGYKLSEYGLFRTDDDALVAAPDEAEIYRLLELAPIPPELRENCGEVEAAAAGSLPRLLEATDIRGDLHMHTRESDGEHTLEEMAEAAHRLGYEYIAVTDHSRSVTIANGLDEERMLRQVERVREWNLKRPLPVHVFAGAEVDILAGGELDYRDALLQQLDLVVASVHSRMTLSREEMTARVCRALENPHVTVLGHPTGRLILKRQPYALDLDAVLECARRHGVAVELNAYPARLDLSDLHCRQARQKGVLVAISSDSHHRDMLESLRYGVHTARRGWLGPSAVLNTRSLGELQAYLSQRRAGASAT